MFRVLLILGICVGGTLFSAEKVIVVAVAGGTGSGKTTLAHKIQAAISTNSQLLSQDSYYKDLSHLSLEEREKVNFDHPDSLDFALLKHDILELKEGRAIEKPVYSFKTHTRTSQVEKVKSCQVLIVEGILILARPELRDLFDMKIFIDADDDVRLLRRIERDIVERARDLSSIKQQYLSTVKPMHDLFVQPSKQFADVIVPKGGENLVALNLILSNLKAQLEVKALEERE